MGNNIFITNIMHKYVSRMPKYSSILSYLVSYSCFLINIVRLFTYMITLFIIYYLLMIKNVLAY